MLPLLNAADARNAGRGNSIIAQEMFIISLAITDAVAAGALEVTVQHDTVVSVNGVNITGSVMTNDDAVGHMYYTNYVDQTDAKFIEQTTTIIKYFQSYGYAISMMSTTGNTIAWKLSW